MPDVFGFEVALPPHGFGVSGGYVVWGEVCIAGGVPLTGKPRVSGCEAV